jgi:signal transduction histidine kinase
LRNQKTNAYLKEIADVCGINKLITFHIARHTFATTVTQLNGVSIESLSEMLGHTDIKTTCHYAKMTAMNYQGVGLYLYIPSGIVKKHKGTFSIESEPGKGSSFCLVCP